MHAPSASRISGRTRAAVSAMYVRALRIRGPQECGQFTRGECHDLSAEKIQHVKCFCPRGTEFVACEQFSNVGAACWVRKFQAMADWRTWRLTSQYPIHRGSGSFRSTTGSAGHLDAGQISSPSARRRSAVTLGQLVVSMGRGRGCPKQSRLHSRRHERLRLCSP